jgi:hypothetical protein
MRRIRLRNIFRRSRRAKPRIPIGYLEVNPNFARRQNSREDDTTKSKRTRSSEVEPTRFQFVRAVVRDAVKGITKFCKYNVIGILPADFQKYFARKMYKNELKANDFSKVSLITEGVLSISCVFGPMWSAAGMIPKIPHEIAGSIGKLGFFLFIDSALRFVNWDFQNWKHSKITATGSIFPGLIYNSIKVLSSIKRATIDSYFANKREELREKNM